MAEARSAVTKPHAVEPIDEEPDTLVSVLCAWRRSIFRRYYRTMNSLRNGMWPTSIYNLAVTTGLVFILLIGDWNWARPFTQRLWTMETIFGIHLGLPYYLRLFAQSATFGLIFFFILMYIRRYLLRLLFSYQGWLFEPPKRQSKKTIVWGFLVRLISGYQPSLYSYQASLPKLPVPHLKDTLISLIESLKPLYGAESAYIKELKINSKEFEKTLGHKLQHILRAKSWLSQNYVTDWWEKYIYLMGRSSLIINSNYYVLDHSYTWITKIQSARAAVVVHLFLEAKLSLDREQFIPLVIRNTVPLCMSQYERMFHTTRIPGMEIDTILHHEPQVNPHIVVQYKGHFFKMALTNKKGVPLQPTVLQKQFQWIIDNAMEEKCDNEHLCALTYWERTKWAKTRQEYFSNGVNRDFMDTLERAMLFVSLDEEVHHGLTERAKAGLHGNGANIWADKSITLIFTADGKTNINGEHSWADAPALGHVLEYAYSMEIMQPHNYYDDDGNAIVQKKLECPSSHHFKTPERMIWECQPNLSLAIDEAFLFAKKNIADLDLIVCDHTSYGKGFVKTCEVSPDAYFQMSIQLAYYRMHKRFALTYESAMMRLFLNGRTETVRSLTQEGVDFVLAMVVQTVDQGLKVRLFRRACDRHQQLYKNAMAGLGIDRHLFALFVAAKGFGYESEFLKSVLTLPWTLSTSQQPQQQLAWAPSCDLPQYRNAVSPGGGFGPVADDGYGISYMMAGDFRMFFHVSSKRSCPETDSTRFSEAIFQALADIKALFDKPIEAIN